MWLIHNVVQHKHNPVSNYIPINKIKSKKVKQEILFKLKKKKEKKSGGRERKGENILETWYLK